MNLPSNGSIWAWTSKVMTRLWLCLLYNVHVTVQFSAGSHSCKTFYKHTFTCSVCNKGSSSSKFMTGGLVGFSFSGDDNLFSWPSSPNHWDPWMKQNERNINFDIQNKRFISHFKVKTPGWARWEESLSHSKILNSNSHSYWSRHQTFHVLNSKYYCRFGSQKKISVWTRCNSAKCTVCVS